MVERAIYECACAGCRTIYVVCSPYMEKFWRNKLGDFVQDPFWLKSGRFTRNAGGFPRPIPVIYVTINVKDLNRRDCYSWSIIWGAMVAGKVTRVISAWVSPRRFFVAHPYGMYPNFARNIRKTLAQDRNFIATYEGQSIETGAFLPFIFGYDEIKKVKQTLLQGSRRYMPAEIPGEVPTVKYKGEDKYPARYYDLKKCWEGVLSESEDTYYHEIDWYYPLDSWKGYRKYMGSKEINTIRKPKKKWFFTERFPLIQDDEEEITLTEGDIYEQD